MVTMLDDGMEPFQVTVSPLVATVPPEAVAEFNVRLAGSVSVKFVTDIVRVCATGVG